MTLTELRAWLEGLAEVGAMLPARALLDRLPEEGQAPAPTKREAEPDRLLKVEEAASRLGVHRSWLYRHSGTLPFAKKLTGGTLRFSERGLEKWQASR